MIMSSEQNNILKEVRRIADALERLSQLLMRQQ
jgi:hypothetical protein